MPADLSCDSIMEKPWNPTLLIEEAVCNVDGVPLGLS
jgi:hypothetical protein